MINSSKFTIDYLIRFKCAACADKSFCKLKYYYSILENPTNKDISNLTNCLFYKKVS